MNEVRPDPDLEGALANIIANTRRVRRGKSITNVARSIRTAAERLGGLKELAETVGLSEQMLRDFLAVERLAPEAERLVEQRMIDSVDVVVRLSRLPGPEQAFVGRAVLEGRLQAAGVRAVLALRKAVPDGDISWAIERFIASRNVNEYLVEVVLPSRDADVNVLRARCSRALGDESVRSLTASGVTGVIALSEEGWRLLKTKAKEARLTRLKLIESILRGEVTR